MSSLPPFFEPYQRPIQAALNAFVPEPAAGGAGTPVVNAMRATLLAPAKRGRAGLVLLAADLCGGTATFAMPAACSVEAIHASSLVLDDLPCMDDAELRRGQPAAHIQFGEAVAILAAFGLLNEAFGHLARSYDGVLAQRLSATLSNAVGLDGLIAGQCEDVLASETTISFESLERIHRRKTGVLFSAAASAGAITAGAHADDISALTAYAKNLGLAFQIVDDLLDVTSTTAETGKVVRADARKTTFVSFSGIDGARALAGELCETAKSALMPFGRRAASLHALADFVAARRG